jgi:2-polyprenyl-3-methyl-5-hydroxy-6-metoxy-1,4-benzoquinol methylase
MGWRKYLLIPQLTWYALRAPRNQRQAWERYWSRTHATGPAGDVLWDGGEPEEAEATAARFRAHADPTLPIVDVGCGNGRQARALARLASRVIGIDGSAAAIRRAGQESDDANIEFRVADVTDDDLGRRLRAELGEANVHVRGVLHIVNPVDRPAVVRNLAELLGSRGTAFICETNAPGDPLDCLLMQGATPTSMPEVLRRCVAAGIRPPSHFGRRELAEYFPTETWDVLESGPTTMYGVPNRPGGGMQRIPSYFAVLRLRERVG